MNMKNLWTIAIVLLMTMPMIPMAVLGAVDEGAVADEGGASSRQGIDLVNMVGQGYVQTHYPGDNEQFYIRVTVTYAGAVYPPPPAPIPPAHVIYRTKVTVDAITDANFNVVTNSPITWVTNTLDDMDATNNPLNLTQGNAYDLYPDNEHTVTSRLEFNVKTTAVPLGTYNLRFRVASDLISDYTAGPPASYTYTNHWEYAYLQLDILTPLTFVSSNSYDDLGTTAETIYAGAVHEKYAVSVNQAAGTGTINNMNAKLEIADTHFKIVDPVAVSNAFLATPEFWWMIDVAKGTPPMLYRATVTYSYDREITPGAGFIRITEAPPSLRVDLRVEWTPLLDFPGHSAFTDPLVVLTQNTPETDFTVPISNGGNVRLENVFLRIDLDNTQYFEDGQFYYNENANGAVVLLDITCTLGNLSIGETKQATFSDVAMRDFLPPGKYIIPIDYTANYYDNGTFGASDYKKAGFWDDFAPTYLQYQTIHVAADYPQPTAAMSFPYIFVEIVDDSIGIQVDAELNGGPYSPGNTYNPYMTVYNREKYQFTSPIYSIHTDEGSPIKRVGTPDSDTSSTTLAPIRRPSLNAATTDGFYIYFSTKQKVVPGTNYITVDVQAFDPHFKPVSFSFNLAIVMYPNYPGMQMLSNSVELLPDGSAAVTVNVQNAGWGKATNMSMVYMPDSASMTSLDQPAMIGDVLPDQTINYTFHVKSASPMQALYGWWYGYIYYGYTDEAGTIHKQFDYSIYVDFVIQPKLPSLTITNVNAPGVNPGDTLQVTVNIVNMGGSTAFAAKAIWASSNGYFACDGQDSFDLGDIAAGANASVTFTVKASTAVMPQTSYYIYIYVSYNRVDGFGMTYSEGGGRSFYLNSNREVIPSKSEQVVESRQSGYTWDLGYMFLGLFIFLAIVIGVMIYKKPTHPTAHVRYDDMDRTEPASRHAEDDWRRPGSGGSGGAPPQPGTAQKK